jgi:dTDP-4-dehydrorhamnose reductase
MRTIILGANGQLGRELVKAFRSFGELHAFDREQADICNAEALQPLFERVAPELVINAAAYTDVEAAEQNLEEAFRANETGARNTAELAAYHNIPIVYFSTDFVFDGAKSTPYEPNDPIAPLSIYGKSKAAGEAATRKATPLHYIIRTAWLYGHGRANFVEKILDAAKKNGVLRVTDEETGSPTYARDLAEAVFYLVRARKYGTYHAVNEGACTRHAFARAIVDALELPVRVETCPRSALPHKAPRPRYSVLSNRALHEVTEHRMRPWKEALLDYLQRRESGT